MFISETGFPHSACQVDGDRWYGYKPSIPKSPLAKGIVDRSSRALHVKTFVTLTVADDAIEAALAKILRDYRGDWYCVGVKDCVTFTADLAEAMGLIIPPRPNFLPEAFVANLRKLNFGRLVDATGPTTSGLA
jgi:hypothetical protein